ncbi:MAG: hypothetical protein HYX91_06040 [Chloroflexi bacterium]|nr:hypothetical protein [Chloroflexota bacterium]
MVFDVLKYRAANKAWQEKYDALAPKAGDIAPDFELCDVKGQNPIRLSAFQGQKPVALVFGSYT